MINAYVAKEPGAPFEPFQYDPGKLGPHDVEIAVKHCGICHSDLSMWKNDWEITEFPFVGGHEVAGVVASVGDLVTNVQPGDNVGLGWHKGYCNTCSLCLSGDHNLCQGQIPTIVGNYGGFADKVRAQDTSVIKIPKELPLKDAGPLLCGGITVFNPFVQLAIKPTDKVGVIGIGGLGHMALQFARAWGCEVTAFTSKEKMDEAVALGAHHCLPSRDPKALEEATKRFDLVLSTVNVPMDWAAILNTLKPKGHLHLLGVVLDPIPVSAFSLIGGQNSISGSPVGSPATLTTMMEFAARHGIKPITEHFKFSKINEAFHHLEHSKPRFRIVLDQD